MKRDTGLKWVNSAGRIFIRKTNHIQLKLKDHIKRFDRILHTGFWYANFGVILVGLVFLEISGFNSVFQKISIV